jgi:hypothetical protein
MPDNTINWGQGAVENTNDWGKGKTNSANNWGKVYETSPAGDTNIEGGLALSITYPASALCENASNPTPTVSGNEGSGTFSSTAGLVFVSTSTGEVNISSSTAGATYLITYTDTNAATATFSLTINNLDNAAFAYSASSFEPTGSDPTPTITGLSGGTFSSTSGLVFVDSGTNTGSSTGEIDLSASTIASYTITYDTTSSGSSVCPNTSTQTVEIALAGIANNYSMNFDGSDDYIDAGMLTEMSGATQFSISVWFKYGWASGAVFKSLFGNRDASNSYRGIGFEFGKNPISKTSSFYLTSSTGTGAVAFPPNTFTSNQWHHLVITYDGTTAKGYVDNGTALTSSFSGATFTVTTNFSIGKDVGSGSCIPANIDEFAIWNTALTSTQVSEIYSATSTNLTKDLTTVSGSNLKYWNRMGD